MSGTLKEVRIDGLTYNVMAEADANFIGGVFENTPVVHSGGSSQKKVRRADSITGIILEVTALEHDALRKKNNESVASPGYPLSVVDSEGNSYKTTGFISYQQKTNQDNAGTVDLHSMVKKGWELFAA